MSELAVTLTVEQLKKIIDDTVSNALSRHESEPVKEVFTLLEAAEFLGRHPRQISKLIREQALPAHYISDREPRFRRSELLNWLASRPKEPKQTDEES
jgi:excisionase family DNA binding protein